MGVCAGAFASHFIVVLPLARVYISSSNHNTVRFVSFRFVSFRFVSFRFVETNHGSRGLRGATVTHRSIVCWPPRSRPVSWRRQHTECECCAQQPRAATWTLVAGQ